MFHCSFKSAEGWRAPSGTEAATLQKYNWRHKAAKGACTFMYVYIYIYIYNNFKDNKKEKTYGSL